MKNDVNDENDENDERMVKSELQSPSKSKSRKVVSACCNGNPSRPFVPYISFCFFWTDFFSKYLLLIVKNRHGFADPCK